MKRDVSFLDSAIPTCGDPQIGVKLASLGYSSALVRRSPAASKLPTPLPEGIALSESFEDADLYSVAGTPQQIVALSADGFFGHEHHGDDWWEWMGMTGRWK